MHIILEAKRSARLEARPAMCAVAYQPLKQPAGGDDVRGPGSFLCVLRNSAYFFCGVHCVSVKMQTRDSRPVLVALSRGAGTGHVCCGQPLKQPAGSDDVRGPEELLARS